MITYFARSGRDLLVFGILIVGFAIVLPLYLTTEHYSLTMTVVLATGALLLCVVGWRRANRLLAERRTSSHEV